MHENKQQEETYEKDRTGTKIHNKDTKPSKKAGKYREKR